MEFMKHMETTGAAAVKDDDSVDSKDTSNDRKKVFMEEFVKTMQQQGSFEDFAGDFDITENAKEDHKIEEFEEKMQDSAEAFSFETKEASREKKIAKDLFSDARLSDVLSKQAAKKKTSTL